MHAAVLQRKREILGIIDRIKKSSVRKEFRHEMMTYAYILSNGAIEFMVETILREWVKDHEKRHAKSKRYRGKVNVAEYLLISVDVSNDLIGKFHNPSYSSIVELVKNVAGDKAKERFKTLVDKSKTTEPELNAKLDRLNKFRHRLAHGNSLPKDEQPNLDELRADFKSIYGHIIMNIDIALITRK